MGQQRRQELPVGADRRLRPQVLVLDHEPSRELVTKQPVRVVRHRDALDHDRAVVEDGVSVQEAAEIVTPQPDRERRAVLEVKDLVAEADGGVTAAGATLVGVDVQVVDGQLGRRPRHRRSEKTRGEDEGGAEPARATPSRRRIRP